MTIHDIQPDLYAFLPPPPKDMYTLERKPLKNGNLAILYSDFNHQRLSYEAYRQTLQKPHHFLLTIFDGTTEHEAFHFINDNFFFSFDQFQDGSWLIYGMSDLSDHTKNPNAMVLASDGTIIQKLRIFSYFDYMQIDGQDRIWMASREEVMYGQDMYNPDNLDYSTVICFDKHAKPLFTCAEINGETIDDCYAFNAGYEKIFLYYYSCFDVAELSTLKAQVVRNGEVGGANMIAFHHNMMILAKTYENPYALTILDLSLPQKPEQVATITHSFGPLISMDGRENYLHYCADDCCWLRFSVENILKQCS